MKNVSIICILILLGCSNSNTQTEQTRFVESELKKAPVERTQNQQVQEKSTKELIQPAKGLFKNTVFIDSLRLESFQKEFLEQLVNNGEGEFETDSAYIIDNVKRYDVEFGYSVFYIKGQFIPSTVEFHYYGGYYGKQVRHDIYHLPIETFFTLTKYECSDGYLRVYGILEDENSEESEENLLFGLYR